MATELGYSGFIRFIRQVEGHNGQDYLKEQEELYRDMSLDQIFEEAQKHSTRLRLDFVQEILEADSVFQDFLLCATHDD